MTIATQTHTCCMIKGQSTQKRPLTTRRNQSPRREGGGGLGDGEIKHCAATSQSRR